METEPGQPDQPAMAPQKRPWSRLSLFSAMLSVPAFVVILVVPGFLLHRLIGMEMGNIGPWFLTLLVGVWVGYLGGILGGLAARLLKGPEPDRRGRSWALFSTVGVRGLLMVVVGALGSVVLGRGEFDGGGDPQFVQHRWLLGVLATLGATGLYVRSRIRRSGQPARGRGWLVFTGGLLLHLLLIAALPVSMFQAFATFRPEVVRGGGQNRRYEGPREAGLFAQKTLRVQQAPSQEASVILRLWHDGHPRELGRRKVTGPTTLEWKLIEGEGSASGMRLRWSSSDQVPAETWPVGLPTGKELVPSPGSAVHHQPPSTKISLWIFQDFGQWAPMSNLSKPDWAVEVMIESGRDH